MCLDFRYVLGAWVAERARAILHTCSQMRSRPQQPSSRLDAKPKRFSSCKSFLRGAVRARAPRALDRVRGGPEPGSVKRPLRVSACACDPSVRTGLKHLSQSLCCVRAGLILCSAQQVGIKQAKRLTSPFVSDTLVQVASHLVRSLPQSCGESACNKAGKQFS